MAGRKVIVVGGGAAGLFAAARAAELGAQVVLMEKTDALGKKILVSGKGRCNLTNARTLEEFIPAYGPNGRFLYRAFRVFFRQELIDILGRYGLEVTTERGGRIFPSTGDAEDVIRVCRRRLEDNRVEIKLNSPVSTVEISDGKIRGVLAQGRFHPADAVIMATGGVSWPATGSSGDGQRMAAALGHRIVPLRPALVPLIVAETSLAASMQGVTLKNVRLTSFSCSAEEIDPALAPIKDVGRGLPRLKAQPPVIESRIGEMMMTHFGIGGPVTLQMSLPMVEALARGPVSVAIDLKPALSAAVVDRRLQADLATQGKRHLKGILAGLVPRKLVEPLAELAQLSPDKPAHQISAAERKRLGGLLKSLRFNIREPLPIAHAIVTAGGVDLSEIDPRRMASRLVEGLYFCGELMDIDADTGGYNLQAAFSTGHLAGEAAACPERSLSLSKGRSDEG